MPTTTNPPRNAREAHKQLRVWAHVKLNGGAVRFGKTAVGTIESKGPVTAEQGLAIHLLSLGMSPLAIHEKLLKKGYVNEDGSWAETCAEPPRKKARS